MPIDIPQPPQLPDDNREGNRHWLNILLERHFEGNVSAMADSFGLDSAGRKRLERVLRGQTKTVPGDLVKEGHRYVHEHDDLTFAPSVETSIPYTRHATVNGFRDHEPVSLPYVTYEVDSGEDGAYHAVGHVQGEYFVDPSLLNDDTTDPGRSKAVTSMVGDAMHPEIRSGDALVLDLAVDDATPVPSEGVYLYRLEDALHIRRVRRLPGRRLEFRDGNDVASFVLSLDEDPDLEVVGRVWLHPRRL